MTHDQDPRLIERLVQDAQALEARMLPEDGTLTQDQVDYARNEIVTFIQNEGMAIQDVMRSIDHQISATTVEKFLRGERVGDKTVRFLTRWMQQTREAVLDGAPTELVSTRLADQLIAVLSNTHRSRSMSIISGPSGVGKSTVAKAAAYQLIPGTLYFEIPSIVKTGHQLLRFMAEHLKLRGRSSAQIAQRRIVEHLTGTGRLLIADECHFLNQDGLLVLRDLHKMTGCPIAMMGTRDLRDACDDFTEFRGQFHRLISYTYDISAEMGHESDGGPMFTPEDAAAYIKSMKLRLTMPAPRLSTELVNIEGFGGLGKLTLILTNASRLLDDPASQRIDDSLLRDVLREMEGLDNTQRVTLHVSRRREQKKVRVA